MRGEGDEGRKGKGRESKEFPALDLTRGSGFLRGEVHARVCVRVPLCLFTELCS